MVEYSGEKVKPGWWERNVVKHQRYVIRHPISGGNVLYIISIMSDRDAENCILYIITFIYSIIFLPEILGCIAWRNSIKPRGNAGSESYQFDISSSAVTVRPKYSPQASFSLAWNCQVLKQFILWINLQPVFHWGRYSSLHQSSYFETLLFLFVCILGNE